MIGSFASHKAVGRIETDHLVVGAGTAGLAFADALIADSDADVVLVDRRHQPGGHWNDAYPFVCLHQPSAFYGVNSRMLGGDSIDQAGPNAGMYERAGAASRGRAGFIAPAWRAVDGPVREHDVPAAPASATSAPAAVSWAPARAAASRAPGSWAAPPRGPAGRGGRRHEPWRVPG